MLYVPGGAGSFGLVSASWGTARPAAAQGATVIPTGSTGDFGAWAAVGSPLTRDAYGITLIFNTNNQAAQSRNTVVNVGIDPTGSTNYTTQIARLIAGGAHSFVSHGTAIHYYFPMFIPSGSAVAVQARATVSSGSPTASFNAAAVFYQQAANASGFRCASFVETLGVASNDNAGTTITPGTTSDGAWTLIGTVSKRSWWWQFGVQIGTNDASWNLNSLLVDVAVGDGSTKDIIIQDAKFTTGTAEDLSTVPYIISAERDVPSGSAIYMRIQNSGANDTYRVAVYAAGG